jgi:hypothetical protein
VKYSWPKLVKETRKAMIELVEFKCKDAEASMDMHIDFKMLMRATDTFHAWNDDDVLERAFRRMPEKCNYRSCKSYWAYKDGKNDMEDSLNEYLYGMSEIIQDYYDDVWNFEPRYVRPKKIIIGDIAGYVSKNLARIIRTVRE